MEAGIVDEVDFYFKTNFLFYKLNIGLSTSSIMD